MVDYNSLTVANLRILLKERNIPSTGLTRKAQIIAKLQEQDTATQSPLNQTPQITDVPVQPTASTEAPHPSAPEPVAKPKPVAEPEPVADAPEPPKIQTLEAPVATPANVEVTPRKELEEESQAQTSLPTKEDSIKQSPVPTAHQSTTEASSSQLDTDAEESKKRKRRSLSPPVNSREVSIKKAKYLEGNVHLEEDGAGVPVVQQENRDAAGDATTADKQDLGDVEMTGVTVPSAEKTAEEAIVPSEESSHAATSPNRDRKAIKDARYQTLFKTDKSETEAAPSLSELPTPPPAIHPATRALYIRNFQRPLQLSALRSHLTALAMPSETESSSDPVELLHIDSIKTHCFVVLSTQAAAARIRAGLHDQVWPKESGRKALWADYIPDEKVQEWIDVEGSADSGNRAGGRRWEVVYEGPEGELVAELREVGAAGGRLATSSRDDRRNTAPSSELPLPTSPSATKHAQAQAQDVAKPFVTLDKLFNSTTAKPMLYYKPVKTELADKRKDEFAAVTSRDWSTRDWKESDPLRRYTFEESKLVDSGPHNLGAKAKAREQGVLGGFTRGGGPSYGGGGGGGYGGGYGRGGGYGGGTSRGGSSWRGR